MKRETHRRMDPDGFLFIKQPSQVRHLLSLPDSVRQEYFHHFFLREKARHTDQDRSWRVLESYLHISQNEEERKSEEKNRI